MAALLPGAPAEPVAPGAPFWASTTGEAHSPLAMVSVASALLAVATVTYTGSVPAGTVVDQPLSVPVSALVAKV